MAASDPFDMLTLRVDLVKLMHAELGIHPDNGKHLLAAGYVTLDGVTLTEADALLPLEDARGRFVDVLGRKVRLQPPTKQLPAQGGLF